MGDGWKKNMATYFCGYFLWNNKFDVRVTYGAFKEENKYLRSWWQTYWAGMCAEILPLKLSKQRKFESPLFRDEFNLINRLSLCNEDI